MRALKFEVGGSFEGYRIGFLTLSLITSRSNSLVRRLRALASREGRERYSLLLLEGTNLLNEALLSSCFPIEIVATTARLKEHLPLLQSLPKEIRITEVTNSVLEAALTTKSPDGVAALFPLNALPKPSKQSHFVLALDRLQDPGNLGTLFRTALAADVEVVWLALGADPLSQKVLRASAGAVLHLPYERFGSSESIAVSKLVQKLELAALGGHQIVGTFLPGSLSGAVVPYWEIDWTKPTVLVLGNEGSGLHSMIKTCCTHCVTLPHSSSVESLNVASAAVPLLLERRRAKMSIEI